MPSPSPALPPIGSDNGRRLWNLLDAIAGGSARLFTPDGADEPYRALVEQMGDGVGILSGDGRLLYANPRLAELLDRPGETLLGRALAELIPPSQGACLDRLHKVSPGRTERAELELAPDEGEPIRVLAAVSGLQGAGLGTHCVILTDLSGLRAPGMARASDDHRYRLLEDSVMAFGVEIDEQRCMRWVSPSVHALLGWRPQDLLGACLTDLLHPEETFEAKPPTGQHRSQVPPLLRLRARDGADRWMRFLSWPLKGEGRSPCRWMIGFQDMSEVVALQQARAIDQARLAALLMSSSGPHIILDTLRESDATVPDFVCAAANDAACRRYGLTRDELVGRRLLEALPAHAAVGLVALCHRALESDHSMAWAELDEPTGASPEKRRSRIRVDRVGDGLSCSWSEVVSHPAAPILQRLPQPSGLVNRSDLLEQLWRNHPPSHRRTQPLALALCHLHNLRTIHEDQGIESADRVVQAIQERVRQVLPNNTIVARVNVDQLLVVLGCMNNHAQAQATAESIRAVLALSLPHQGALIRITAWVDVTLEQPGECMEDLISSALQQSRGGALAQDTVT